MDLLQFVHVPEVPVDQGRIREPPQVLARRQFRTGWFVEPLATQTLVLFVIRSAGNPLRSQPSCALTANTSAIVLIGMALPFSPLTRLMGFVPLPATYFFIVAVFTATYLGLVEVVKRRLMRHLSSKGPEISLRPWRDVMASCAFRRQS